MSQVERQLQAARQKLLDLTMRNRLLNHRPSKARTIKVVDEIATEIYDILVLNERVMEFLPKKEKENGEGAKQLEFEQLEQDVSELSDEEASILWELGQPEEEVADRHIDRFLQTSFDKASLQKRLFYIYQQARSVLEEQGYTVLYLALGFLEWRESPDSFQSRLAPLILIPAELDRTKVRSSIKLRWTGEDIFTNISLHAKLSEQGIALPEFEMPEDKTGIDHYFKSVVESVSGMPNWEVLANIYLDFFSFTKFIMYKDLDPISWPEGMSPLDHPLIQTLLDPSEDTALEQGFNEEDVDKKLEPRKLYHVMDADPSQIAVIEDVKSGINLAVEGPPGTGKSQTITNIIAELLALGKTVLFVSEKMAALEVVKSRLDIVGLGDFCLELHSRKSKKKSVLKELERAIQRRQVDSISMKDEFDRLESLTSDLNDYANALRMPLGKFGRSPFNLFGMKESARNYFTELGRDMPTVSFPSLENCTQSEWSEAISQLTDIADLIYLVRPVSTHPWRGCEPSTILPADEAEIVTQIGRCQKSLGTLEYHLDHLTEICGIKRPSTLLEMTQGIKAAKVIADSKPVDKNVLLNDEWNKPNEEAEALINKVKMFQVELSKTLDNFEENALDQDVEKILEEYRLFSQKFFRLFYKRYRQLKRNIHALYKNKSPKNRKQIVVDLEQLEESSKIREEIRKKNTIGRRLFDSHWRDENSDPSTLQSFTEWIITFRKQLLAEILSKDSVDLVSKGVTQNEILEVVRFVSKTAKELITHTNLLNNRVRANYQRIFEKQLKDIPLFDLSSKLNLWKTEIHKLQRWAQFVAFRKSCLKTIASSVIELIDSDRLMPEDIIPCFKGNFADALLKMAFEKRPAIANFIGELHEKKIKSFMELDSELIVLNRKRLAYKLYKEQPVISGGASSGSEAGILLGEFSRRRGHMPIRKLMAHAGGLVQKIKPCFMMSPLSIAQFLDPRTVRFDYIIFDEASQVRPEDALGALLRGNKIVVMGDTRQLPPTSFFDHIIDRIDETDEDLPAMIADVESILHQCKRCFPSKILRWHYRSRHESLIAVSNQEFYDNRLLIYPSPIDKLEDLGLEFIHLPDTIYDRGKSSANRKEARTVAMAALEHYRKNGIKSLGVGTFNIKQQQAILEEVELQLRLHPDMEDFFSSNHEEHFFVKNLETIQGDERDVIFLSIGYGYDMYDRLTRNFGPLNHEGGERRLNVLITRARIRCVVFSNFRAGDLNIDENAPFGLKALKLFLDYAENRNLQSIEVTGEDTDSPFEDSVYDFLRSRGLDVRKQVGCAGFRVDLAVVDPKSPGRYLLGIECDGAKYHSSPVARDRDRLRQQILEGLGWRLHRIWSTDWYRNRLDSEKRLLEALATAEDQKGFNINNSKKETSEVIRGVNLKDTEKDRESIVTKVETNLNDRVVEYEKCSSIDFSTSEELHEKTTRTLAFVVTKVVEVEGPIHFSEVVRRIRSFWGLRRAGKRINNTIEEAAKYAERVEKIHWRNDFLWPAPEHELKVRRRIGDPPAKIELICDEEIAEAIKLVLKHQFATLPNDLIIQSARLFGIRAVHTVTQNRIQSVITNLLKSSELIEMPNGMIDLA